MAKAENDSFINLSIQDVFGGSVNATQQVRQLTKLGIGNAARGMKVI